MTEIHDPDVTILLGDAATRLRDLAAGSAQCLVTSPPFWALRDYGVDGQIGLEATPDEWCAALVNVFRECRRVLRDDGVMWVEVGDTYAAASKGSGGNGATSGLNALRAADGTFHQDRHAHPTQNPVRVDLDTAGVKAKDLVGAPWMLAFALRADGWYLRSDTIWARPNPMPESVTDRPTKAHSYVFLLSKQARYYYDADAIREEAQYGFSATTNGQFNGRDAFGEHTSRTVKPGDGTGGRNARSVWSIPTEPTPFAHFATFPQALVERCVKSGSREGDTVLDPFMGSGTTALVARRLGRRAVGVELSAEYLRIARDRLQQLSLLA